MDGSEKLPPLIIGKSKRPRAFKGKYGANLGFLYRNNAKAWMTTVLYQEWLRDIDKDMQRQQQFILVLQNNFSSHAVPDDLTNIKVVNFLPNLTVHVQPMDAGIICCFKAHYQRALDLYDQDTSPGQIYDLNQLKAMWMAALAWDAVSPQTIQNCWVKAGILPNDVSRAAAFAKLESENLDPEAELTKVLDQLESCSALQASNRITETEFLNPPDKCVMADAADSEIFAAVMQACKNEQQSEINGGDDGDNEGPNKPLTIHPEALKAVSTLQSYIQSLDGLFAQQLEASLARFGKETQQELSKTMVSTAISNYFTSK